PPEWERLPSASDGDQTAEVLKAILSRLIAAPDQQLQQALLAAIGSNVIPAALRDQIDEIIRKLKRSALVTHSVIVCLLDEGSGDALADVDVRILDLEAGAEPEELDTVATNREGLFPLVFGTPIPQQGAEDARKLRIVVLDATGKDLWSSDIR